MADGNITSSTNLSSTSSSSSSSSLPQQQQQHQQGGKLTNRTLDGKLICKHTNVIQRTTSESLRLGGGDHILAAAGGDGGVGGGGGVSVGGLAAIAALQQQQQPLPPPSSNLNNNINNSSSSSLAASAAARKSKTSSFQITSVTVGTRMSADNGDDSADDLDESHTDDNSRITDLENETPSFSEDTSFSKEDVFFSSHALGTAPVIPTSAQYGLAIVQPENLGGTDVPQQINDVHVSVTDDGINIVGAPNSKNDNPDLKDLNQRNERFKVVKIESTEPFKRGRWMCMDYLDHTTSQPTQSPQGPMIRDGGGGGAAITMDSGVGMSENHIDFENPIGAADSPQKTVQTDIHLQNLINTNLLSGQSAPGGGYPTSASTSPGQSLIQPMLGELNSNIAIASHAQTMSHPIVNMPNIVAAAQQPAQSMPQQQLQQIISTNVEQAAIPHPNIVQGQSQPAQFFANPAHHPHHHHHHHSPHPHHHSHHHPAQHQGQTLPAGALHGLIAQSNQNVGAAGAAVVAAGGGGQAMSMGHIPISQPQIVDLNNMIPINPAANFPTQNASQTQIPQTILLTDNYAAQSSGPVTNVIVGAGPNTLPAVENQNFIAGNVAIVASTAAVPVAVIPTAVTAAVGQVSSNVSQSPIGLSLQNSVNAVVNSVVGSMNVNIDELAIGNKVNVLSPTAAAAVTAGTAGTVPTAAVAVGDISVMQTMLQQQQQQPSSSGSTGSDSVVIEGATATTTNTDNGVGDDQQNAEDSESVSGLALALKNNHHPKSQNVISTPRSHYLKNQRPRRTVVTENIYNPTRRESNVYTNLALGNCMENLMKNTTSQVLPKQMCRIHVENASDTCGVCVAATTTTSSAHNIPHKNVQTILREDGIQIPTTQNQWTGEAHSLPNKMNISPPSGRYSSMNNYNSNNQSPGQMNMTPSTSPSFGSSYLEVYNGGSGKVSRAVSPQPYLSSSGGSTTAGDYSASGTSAVAIDNKIEQAMDLVKSHLMFAVREEVEVLKEKIAELMDRINQLEVENTILKANATQETLTQLTTTATTVAPTTKSPQNPTNGPIS